MRYNRKTPFRYTFEDKIPALFQIIKADNTSSSPGKAKIIDLSLKGMRLNSGLHIPMKANQPIRLAITFEINDTQWNCLGEIVWQKRKGDTYDYGIEFLMDEAETKELIHQLKIYSRNHRSHGATENHL